MRTFAIGEQMNSPPPSRAPAQPPPAYAQPRLEPSPDILFRYHARVLDPTTAATVARQAPAQPTVYIAGRLLAVRGVDNSVLDDLDTALSKNSLQPTSRKLQQIDGSPIDIVPLVPADPDRDDPRPPTAPDAWQVLQTLRTLNPGGAEQIFLEHLLAASQHTIGHPFVSEHIYDPIASYGVPGYGGRQPVNWVGPRPARSENPASRRPVVAVLDTAMDDGHPWLAGVVTTPWAANTLRTAPIANPLEGTLDTDAGHATFIAGLIRQHCPDANLINMPIMGGDGLVVESDLLAALQRLIERQDAALAAPSPDDLVDVVVLSLGYYHETITDLNADQPLLGRLRALADRGVAIVCAAGNDATSRPLFPAAFAAPGPVPDGVKTVPISAVGALNPNGTVAMFSNVGTWVRYHRPGAAVVSTHQRINAALQAAVATEDRASIDPDDFVGGFAVWSGTSFAAPVLAGEIAQYLSAQPDLDLGAVDPEERGAALAGRTAGAVRQLVTQYPPGEQAVL